MVMSWKYHGNIIWLVVYLPLCKMMEFVNGKDDIPYMKWKIKHVPNHQPAYKYGGFLAGKTW
jgi:hypothetical protein